MTSAIQSILLDTNVWLDWYLATRPGHDAASRLLHQANAQGITLLHAVTSSKDVFFLVMLYFKAALRKEHAGRLTEQDVSVSREFAWACLENMQAVSTAVGCDESDVWIARKQRKLHSDYEDNLIVAAAMRAQASLLVTNDEGLIRHSPVATLSVEDALKVLPEEATQERRGTRPAARQ